MASAEAIRKLLADGVAKILDLQGHPSDREVGAFTAFRRAVLQASNGKLGTPSDFLDEIEPKDVVLRFLFDLHSRKRLYRKQIAAVMSHLMETAWIDVLRSDEALYAAIPDELTNLVDDEENEELELEGVAAHVQPVAEGSNVVTKQKQEVKLEDNDEHMRFEESSPSPKSENVGDLQQAVTGSIPVEKQGQELNLVADNVTESDDKDMRSAQRSPLSNSTSVDYPQAPAAGTTGIKQAQDENFDEALPAQADDTAIRFSEVSPSPKSRVAGYVQQLALNTAATKQAQDVKPVPTGIEEILGLLEKAKEMFVELNYSAVKSDEAIDAFERFRKAILRVTSLSSPEGRNALESLDCKGQILEFLVDFHSRQKRFRARVNVVLLKLHGFSNWEAAVQEDASVRAIVQELTEDPQRELTAPHAGLAINLGAAATAVGKRGGAGALYVRVFSAKLPEGTTSVDALGRLPDPYVRVTLDGRIKRTIIAVGSREPCWDSEPFIFQVPSVEALVTFEIFDTEMTKDHLLGGMSLCAAEAPAEPGFVTYPLDGDVGGELKLEMVFMPAKESLDENVSVHTDYKTGDEVSYYSQRRKSWFDAIVKKPDCRGVEVDLKPGVFVPYQCIKPRSQDEAEMPAVTWTLFDGYIPSGDEILPVETMTVDEAKVKCEKLPECRGFCFSGPPRSEAVSIYFKSVVRVTSTADKVTSEKWTSFLKLHTEYKTGDKVLYYSQRQNHWFDATITESNYKGIEIDLKPGETLPCWLIKPRAQVEVGHTAAPVRLEKAITAKKWLVMHAGKASMHSAIAQLGETLKCPAGHSIEKKKEGLHWFEGWIGYKHGQNCDLCGEIFRTREEARFRCTEHCQYDICETCYTRGT